MFVATLMITSKNAHPTPSLRPIKRRPSMYSHSVRYGHPQANWCRNADAVCREALVDQTPVRTCTPRRLCVASLESVPAATMRLNIWTEYVNCCLTGEHRSDSGITTRASRNSRGYHLLGVLVAFPGVLLRCEAPKTSDSGSSWSLLLRTFHELVRSGCWLS